MSSDKISKQPLEKIEWVHRDSISPNDYNPNFMGANELELLATSIVEDGWLFPLLITPDKTIIDGYHRYKASGTYPRVYALTDGYLPVITVDQSKADELMLRTIRMNRAKGVHGVTQMSAIIKHMISEGKSMQEMTTRLKMEEEEVERLALSAGIPATKIVTDSNWNAGWRPANEKEHSERE